MEQRQIAVYQFDERLRWSKGQRQESDLQTIQGMIPGCISVVPSSLEQELRGVDYIATLRRGAEIFIDVKARDSGCSKYWRNGPEVALEIWSDIDRRKTGWTLDESKLSDLILFTFDPRDCPDSWIASFHLLRMAFIKNFSYWTARYRVAVQNSGGWQSKCVFVPIKSVEIAIKDTSWIHQEAINEQY